MRSIRKFRPLTFEKEDGTSSWVNLIIFDNLYDGNLNVKLKHVIRAIEPNITAACSKVWD